MAETIKGFTVFGYTARREGVPYPDLSQSVGTGRWGETYVQLHHGSGTPSISIGGVTTDHGPHQVIDVEIRSNCLDEIFVALCQHPRYRSAINPSALEEIDDEFKANQKDAEAYRERRKSILTLP